MFFIILSAAVLMLGLALFFSVALTIAKARLHVDVDPRIDRINKVLPGSNCGGCGTAGCASFARAVVEGELPMDGCPVGGPSIAALIAEIMGTQFSPGHPFRPVVRCQARSADRLGRAIYSAVPTCAEASVIGGLQACTYGCLGFGDCFSACPYDAITMVDGLPVIDHKKCTDCGVCSRACPPGIIARIAFSSQTMYAVACSNHDPGRAMKRICRVGCIACGACAKAAPNLFELKDNLAELNYDAYNHTDLTIAAAKCPTKVILSFGPKMNPFS